jgi:hypothetical protein
MGVPVADVLGRSFDLVKGHFGAYLRTQGVFLLVAGVAGAAVAWVLVATLLGNLGADPSGADPSADPAAALALLVPTIGASMVLVLTITVLALVGTFFGLAASDALLAGRPVYLGALWAAHRGRFGAFLGATLVASVVPMLLVLAPLLLLLGGPGAAFAALGGMVVALVVAFYLLLRWWLAPVAALLEGASVGDSLQRSAALTRGSFLSILGLMVVLGVLAAIVGSVLGLPISLATSPLQPTPVDPAAALPPSPTGMVLQQLASTLVSLFFGPWGAAAMVLAYRHLGAPPAAAPPPATFPGPAPGSAPAAPPRAPARFERVEAARSPAPAAVVRPAGPCRLCRSTVPAGATFCPACGATVAS